MLPKISLKKLMFLSLGVLIIGVLTNCGSSSGGGGGSGGAAPAAKKPVEKAPVKPACSDPLDIKVSINDADEECLLQANPTTLNFALKSIAAAEEKRTWDKSKVKVVLSYISEDATATACTNVKANSVDKGWVLDFSSSTSCEITVSLKNDSAKQVVYTLKMVGYGISEAADFKIPFFASAAASFVLTKDIELAAETKSLATGFRGQLDGLGHTIKGLAIDAPGTDQFGLISSVYPRQGDATIEIKNLTLSITKLNGKSAIGGLIGLVWGNSGAKNSVQIKDVTVEFDDSAELRCTENCGGLVGHAITAVHFSGIKVTGAAVSSSGKKIGGVIGQANTTMQLTDVTAHFNMNYSGNGESIGLVAGAAKSRSTLSKIDASGAITCEGDCTYIGGVAGGLTESQLSQAKSSLQLKNSSNTDKVEVVGGVVGSSHDSTLTAVYGKLTAEAGNAYKIGSIIGIVTGAKGVGSIKRAVGYLDVTSNGALNNSGSLVGDVGSSANIQQIFAAGSMNAGNISDNDNVGQMIGRIDGELTADNCYSGAFAGKTIPDAAVGDINYGASASFTKCYTRAPNFVKEADLSQVTFNTVYAPTPQTDSLGVTSETLPDPFDLSLLNGSDGTLWTNEYDGNEYTYPMLAYPKEDMGPVSEEDWFEFQTQVNTER